jgi:hypothetical protein
VINGFLLFFCLYGHGRNGSKSHGPFLKSHALIVNMLLTISIHLKMAPKSMKIRNKFPSCVEDGINITKPSKATQGVLA